MLFGYFRLPLLKGSFNAYTCWKFGALLQFRLQSYKSYPMNKAYFRHTTGEDQFYVSFNLVDEDWGVNKQCNMCRKLNETAEIFLRRVTTNVDKILEKKVKKLNKKAKKVEDKEFILKPNVTAQLLLNNSPVSSSFICKNVFTVEEGNCYSLKVLNQKFEIIVNGPWIHNIALPTLIMAGFPVYPLKFEAFLVEKQRSDLNWYKSVNEATDTWELCGTGFLYEVQKADIGRKLKLVCIPRNDKMEGPPFEVIANCNVEEGPVFCPFEKRHMFTQNKFGIEGFRMMSYNILADLYADSEDAKSILFSYCPHNALMLNYRKLLLLKEILGYSTDILCLQEVDSKVYSYDLTPILELRGLKGMFNVKGGTVSEGVATFYSSSKFDLINVDDAHLGSELQTNSLFSEIWEKIRGNTSLSERITSRPTIVQVIALQSLHHNEEIIIVANTHLYFHPDADHIRLLQGILAFMYIQNFIHRTSLLNPGKNISLIFCGDFNSSPDCGIYSFMTKGTVSDMCPDWNSKEGEEIRGVSFSHDLHIESAYGTPKYTNYTEGFKDCLDYIFYQTDRLEMVQSVPLPCEEDLSAHTAIPSVVFPSDHLALVADFKWKHS